MIVPLHIHDGLSGNSRNSKNFKTVGNPKNTSRILTPTIMSATTACQSVDRMHLQLGKYPSRFRPSGGPCGPALILAPVTGPTLYDIDQNPGPLESSGTQTARRDHEQSLRRKRPGKINPWHSSRIIIQVFGPSTR